MKLRQRRHHLLLLTVFSDSAIRSTAASHSTVYRPVDFGDFYRCLLVYERRTPWKRCERYDLSR